MTIRVDLDSSKVRRRLGDVLATLADATPLMKRIAGILEAETEANFAAQGRPHWAPLATSTKKARLKRNNGSSHLQILQDSGILAASISTDYSPSHAQIGSNVAYAAIHQFGGTIAHDARSQKVRLRTDAKGSLLRQGKSGRKKNLAVFAKDRHKRARETWHQVDAYTVTIPARPYLPFMGSPTSATLQPEAERSILDAIKKLLNGTTH
ncbi:MAG: phage virion morphogenesis protein [Azoarcus sp.]|jgi:phage virion morphogenesis protein|nr:phage virion morphogenesis protein [Azoarcus sp.]